MADEKNATNDSDKVRAKLDLKPETLSKWIWLRRGKLSDRFRFLFDVMADPDFHDLGSVAVIEEANRRYIEHLKTATYKVAKWEIDRADYDEMQRRLQRYPTIRQALTTQLIINLRDRKMMDDIFTALEAARDKDDPDVITRTWKFVLGVLDQTTKDLKLHEKEKHRLKKLELYYEEAKKAAKLKQAEEEQTIKMVPTKTEGNEHEYESSEETN